MKNRFDTNSSNNEPIIASIGLTASEIAMLVIPLLIGMIVARLIAVLMLL